MADEKNIQYKERSKEDNPTEDELAAWIKKVASQLKKFFNTIGSYIG